MSINEPPDAATWAMTFAAMLSQVAAVSDPGKYRVRIREVLAEWRAAEVQRSLAHTSGERPPPSPEPDALGAA